MPEISNEIREKVKEYHEYHGDEEIEIVKMIPDDMGILSGILVRIGDDVSVIDYCYDDGYVTEIDFDKRTNEDKLISRYGENGICL